jgi:hypothetical protein
MAFSQETREEIVTFFQDLHWMKVQVGESRKFSTKENSGVEATIKHIQLSENDVAIWSEIFLDFCSTEMYTVKLRPYHEDYFGNIIFDNGYEKVNLKHKLGCIGDFLETSQSTSNDNAAEVIKEVRKSIEHIPALTDITYLKYLKTPVDQFTSLINPILASKKVVTNLVLTLRKNAIENFYLIDHDIVKFDNFTFPATSISLVSPFQTGGLLTEFYDENFGKTFITHGFLSYHEKPIPTDSINENIQKFVDQKVLPAIKVFFMKELMIVKLGEGVRDTLKFKHVVQVLMANQWLKKNAGVKE